LPEEAAAPAERQGARCPTLTALDQFAGVTNARSDKIPAEEAQHAQGHNPGHRRCARRSRWGSVVGAAAALQKQGAEPKPAAQATLVNLNTAKASELETLPGVGAKTAERIIEYRDKNGGFKKVEELMKIKGIGEKSFLKLKDRITVTPPKAEGQGHSGL
jgi:comEA protein